MKKVGKNRQITLPKTIADKARIKPGDEVTVQAVAQGMLVIKKQIPSTPGR